MRTTTTIAALLSAFAMFASACTSEVAPEPVSSASQRVTACGYAEVETAICDRTASLGSCTEFRTDGMDVADAREVCESSDGVFQPNASCSRGNGLLGVCPVEEVAGELRLHYYYLGAVFEDETVPTLACSNLNEGAWCSAK